MMQWLLPCKYMDKKLRIKKKRFAAVKIFFFGTVRFGAARPVVSRPDDAGTMKSYIFYYLRKKILPNA